GLCTEFVKQGHDCDLIYYTKKAETVEKHGVGNNTLTIMWMKGIKILRTGYFPKIANRDFLGQYDKIIVSEYSQIMTYLISRLHPNVYIYNGIYYNLFKIGFMQSLFDWIITPRVIKKVKHTFTKSVLSEQFLASKGFT